LYDTLFKSEDPGELDNWLEDLNPDSLVKLTGCVMSPRLANAKVGSGLGGLGCTMRVCRWLAPQLGARKAGTRVSMWEGVPRSCPPAYVARLAYCGYKALYRVV
jgi:hypothetical protein